MSRAGPAAWATFVVSTGRCGTQWLAAALARAFGARGRVEHEPLQSEYRPRLMLAGADPARLPERDRVRVEAHLAGIERTLAGRDYIETGFPSWSMLPCLLRRFAGRIRVIHLTRHPVPCAYSWQAHGAFVPPRLPHEREKILLHPADAGVQFSEYAARWAALTPFERNLYFWAEVHAFALQLETRVQVPWLRMRYEDMFAGRGFGRLAEFLGMNSAQPLEDSADERIDQHHFLVPEWTDAAVIGQHPRVMEIARSLSYDPLDFDRAALERRYRFTD